MSDDQAVSDPLVAAGSRIRETAKWLTVALGGLGTVLLAGSQLSNIGALPPGDRLWAALTGGAVAVVAAGVILGFAVWAATMPVLSLMELKEPDFLGRVRKSARTRFADRDLFAEEKTLGGFIDRYYEAVTARADGYKAFQEGRIAEQAFSELDADYVRLNGTAKNLVKLASYEVLVKQWQRTYWTLVLAGSVGTVGITVFAWAANPPPSVSASAATPAVLSDVEAVDLVLSESGRGALAAELGSSCDLEDTLGAWNLGTTPAGADLLVDQADCARIRFVLVPSWGVAQTASP